MANTHSARSPANETIRPSSATVDETSPATNAATGNTSSDTRNSTRPRSIFPQWMCPRPGQHRDSTAAIQGCGVEGLFISFSSILYPARSEQIEQLDNSKQGRERGGRADSDTHQTVNPPV